MKYWLQEKQNRFSDALRAPQANGEAWGSSRQVPIANSEFSPALALM
jgi:hypothetical protein